MSREEYVTYRNEGNPEPLWLYYLEWFKKEENKDKKPLEKHEFLGFIQVWPQGMQAYQDVLQKHDVEFNIVAIKDLKNNKLIKYL